MEPGSSKPCVSSPAGQAALAKRHRAIAVVHDFASPDRRDESQALNVLRKYGVQIRRSAGRRLLRYADNTIYIGEESPVGKVTGHPPGKPRPISSRRARHGSTDEHPRRLRSGERQRGGVGARRRSRSRTQSSRPRRGRLSLPHGDRRPRTRGRSSPRTSSRTERTPDETRGRRKRSGDTTSRSAPPWRMRRRKRMETGRRSCRAPTPFY